MHSGHPEGPYVFRVAYLSCSGVSHGACWDCGLLGVVGWRLESGIWPLGKGTVAI